MNKPLRLLHVGTGGRGAHWLDFIAQRDDVTSVACVDVDERALTAARDKYRCEGFTDLAVALERAEVDGVLIASPSLLHGPHAIQALEAGFPVMVEKPLAANLAEAVTVVERARTLGRPLMIAENYRFFRAERTVRKLLESSAIGRVSGAVCVDRRDQPSRAQGSWVKRMKEPFLTEIAVHHFDSFRYLFGNSPTRVWTRTFNPRGSDYDGNGAMEALIELRGGEKIQYSGSFVGSRYQYKLSIRGDGGTIETDRSRVWLRRTGERKLSLVEPVPMPDGEPLRYPAAGMVAMLAQFRAAIEQGTEPETSGRDNLWTLAMFEAAGHSASTGQFTAIDDVFGADLRTRAGIG
ncbi:MAG: Gfo/Idh/MocA family oxidoreductase [Gammaproteobacteria bacterium]